MRNRNRLGDSIPRERHAQTQLATSCKVPFSNNHSPRWPSNRKRFGDSNPSSPHAHMLLETVRGLPVSNNHSLRLSSKLNKLGDSIPSIAHASTDRATACGLPISNNHSPRWSSKLNRLGDLIPSFAHAHTHWATSFVSPFSNNHSPLWKYTDWKLRCGYSDSLFHITCFITVGGSRSSYDVTTGTDLKSRLNPLKRRHIQFSQYILKLVIHQLLSEDNCFH